MCHVSLAVSSAVAESAVRCGRRSQYLGRVAGASGGTGTRPHVSHRRLLILRTAHVEKRGCVARELRRREPARARLASGARVDAARALARRADPRRSPAPPRGRPVGRRRRGRGV